jgi:uncharacterized membrane protein YcjF (UPF0283 family)
MLMNKVAHGLVAAAFAMACCCLWAILLVVEQTAIRMTTAAPLPAFARLCFTLRPFLLLLPLLALAYCMFVWVRKSYGQKSWMAFFATTLYALVLLGFPVTLTGWILLVQLIEIAAKR